jgi:hypothetical protein
MSTKEMADDCSSNNVKHESSVEHEEEDGGVKIGIVKTFYEELRERNQAKEMVAGGNVDFHREAHMHDKAEGDSKKVPTAAKLESKIKSQHHKGLKTAEAKVEDSGGSRIRILKRGELLDSEP